MPLHDLFTYTLPRSDPSPEQPVPQVAICTREPKKSAGVSGKGILSHLLHGVDNTGNVRVWVRCDQESIGLNDWCTNVICLGLRMHPPSTLHDTIIFINGKK